jgi:hypothetical protein
MTKLFEQFPESADAFFGGGASATPYRGSKDVRVVPIVISEFEFCNVQRQIFAADLVEATHDAALQQRPEAIDSLRVDNAIDILLFGVDNEFVIEGIFQVSIAGMFIGSDQANFFGHGLPHEGVESLGIGAVDYAGDDITLAADRADDRNFAGTFAAARSIPLVPMPVVSLAANVGFVNLDNSHQLAEFRIGEARANAVAHVMGGRITAEAHHAMDLQRGKFLLVSMR